MVGAFHTLFAVRRFRMGALININKCMTRHEIMYGLMHDIRLTPEVPHEEIINNNVS